MNLASPVTLYRPSSDEIEQAFRELPRQGKAIVTCAPGGLAEALRIMESVGFVALNVTPVNEGEVFEVSARKAKQGPCFDTGRSATYRGAALAALDDDNHLVLDQFRICQKTADVYLLPEYRRVLEVSEPVPELLQRLATDPLEFDCATYGDDLQRLLRQLSESPPTPCEQESPLLYPGPFRLLVLKDGTVLRRGELTLVARELTEELLHKDGCIRGESLSRLSARSPTTLRELYDTSGETCLLGELELIDQWQGRDSVDFTAIGKISKELRQRLDAMIRDERPYFLLTGTSPDDRFGCCPSSEVGDALQLVDAGVLSCYRSPTPPDACPVTVFAFAGEGRQQGARPVFSANQLLRQRVLQELAGCQHHQPARTRATKFTNSPRFRTLLRWLLLGFVGVSLLVAAVKVLRPSSTSTLAPLVSALSPRPTDRYILCLLHGDKHCSFCARLEAGARQTLQQHFASQVAAGELRFVKVNTDREELRPLADGLGQFTSTLVLLEVSQNQIKRSQLLDGAWSLAYSEQALVEYLADQLRGFMLDDHE